MLYARNIIRSVYLVQVGLFIFIFSQAYILSRYFSDAFTTVEIQSEKLKTAKIALQKANDELEKRVEERTIEILKANEALRQEIEERTQAQEATKKAKKVRKLQTTPKASFWPT